VLKAMEALLPTVKTEKLSTEHKNMFDKISANTITMRRVLKREVAEI